MMSVIGNIEKSYTNQFREEILLLTVRIEQESMEYVAFLQIFKGSGQVEIK